MIITTKTKVCDRCGSQKFHSSYGAINGWEEAGCSWNGDWGGASHTAKIDLCGSCIESFRDWLKQHQKDEQ